MYWMQVGQEKVKDTQPHRTLQKGMSALRSGVEHHHVRNQESASWGEDIYMPGILVQDLYGKSKFNS